MHLFYVHVVRQTSFVGAQRHKCSYKTIRRRRLRQLAVAEAYAETETEAEPSLLINRMPSIMQSSHCLCR